MDIVLFGVKIERDWGGIRLASGTHQAFSASARGFPFPQERKTFVFLLGKGDFIVCSVIVVKIQHAPKLCNVVAGHFFVWGFLRKFWTPRSS